MSAHQAAAQFGIGISTAIRWIGEPGSASARLGGKPHAVEWLSDNGSAYIAKDTAYTARALGLTLLFTPVRSPESNGMSEAFVKTLKREYASITVVFIRS